jgi:hypothetical protein
MAQLDLRTLLAANLSTDWREVAIDDAAERGLLQHCGLPSTTTLALLKAYQRVIRILPKGEEHRALPLLESGLHSAIQIASIPKHAFERHWASLFPGEEALGLTVYRAALSRRSQLLHRHLHEIQRNEPHYRAARFK